MAIEVKLPNLGDGIDSGDVLDVLVKPGDVVKKDQPICEIETDKATVEIPSSHAGTVTSVHVQPGQTVPIGSLLLTLESAGAPTPPVAAPVATTPPAPAPTPPAPAPAAPPKVAKPAPVEAPPAAPRAAPALPPTPAPVPPAAPATVAAEAIPAAGPAIRRLAREVGIDLHHVVGTGESGRITREDVLTAVRKASQPVTSAPASPAPVSSTPAVGAEESPSTPTTTTASNSDAWGPVQVERMTKIRKTIAAKMHESWSTVPRVTNFDDADVTELERIRQASKSDYAARGIKLTSMPFVIKAVALSLRNNPTLNAVIDEANEQIIYKKYINIGIAVDTDRGLVVPALRRPDELSIPDIARALAGIADNARNNNFKIEDLRGGTFSISNLGAVGGTYSTPVINIPEVAILLLGRARKMPVVMHDDQIAVRLMMPLSLSYDHRLVDGATAARFLNDVIAYLQNPSRLLIAP